MFLRLSRPHHHDTINILTVCYFKSIMENKNHQQENFKCTYQSLVNSARILFVEKGYQAVSIDEISGKALVTKGAFYHHFKNKKQLFYTRTLYSVRNALVFFFFFDFYHKV